MSRSYKQAVYKDGYGTKRKKAAKRQANKRLRHILADQDSPYLSIPASYKRHTNPWDICDYVFYCVYDSGPFREGWGFSHFTGEWLGLQWYNADKHSYRKWFRKNGKWCWWK